MTKPAYLLILPIAAGALAAASIHSGGSATETAHRTVGSLDCELRVTRTPSGIELEALASADRSVSGAYEILIEKTGSAGVSTISQVGEFSLTGGEELVLGTADLGLERRASYSANLTVENQAGKILCEAERPGKPNQL